MTDQERADYWKQTDTEPRCDVCNQHMEEVEWCGECGNCIEHCGCIPPATVQYRYVPGQPKPKQNEYTFHLTYITEAKNLEEAESECRAWLADHYHNAELQVETDDPTLDGPFTIYTK